jgi:hypothetical protein
MSKARDLADAASVINFFDSVSDDVQTQIDSAAASGGGAELDSYVIADTSIASYIFKHYEVVPTPFSVGQSWQGMASNATLHVAEVSEIGTDGNYAEADTTLANHHIFYDNFYIADTATLTVPSAYTIHGVENPLLPGAVVTEADKYQSTGKLIFLGVL